jgi:hypothetical protein
MFVDTLFVWHYHQQYNVSCVNEQEIYRTSSNKQKILPVLRKAEYNLSLALVIILVRKRLL